MSRIFVFPGQGSQTIGMGKELHDSVPAARAVFEEVDEALGQNLSGLMFEGDPADLQLTENTQPALMTHSVATVRALEALSGKRLTDYASFVAGHSLGEYSALCSAGVLSLADTARLLKLRGQAMQRAVPVGEGAMAAVLGLTLDQVEAITADTNGLAQVANDNADGQVVISGAKAAVEAAAEEAKTAGAKRALLLPVSAPFHCSLMQPAADEMAAALAETEFSAPSVPVIANVTTVAETDPARLRDLLVQQITGRVRWRESMASLAGLGVTQMAECGTGKVLSGLIRRIDKSVSVTALGTPADIEAFLSNSG